MTQENVSQRWAQIDRSLDDALSQAEPEVGAVMRATIGELRGRLRRVHARPDQVGGLEWAAYVAGLDRGVAELQS